MDNRQAGLSTQKVAALAGSSFQSLVHSSWHLPQERKDLVSRMYQRNLFSGFELLRNRDEVFHGTDFRHAVEFSRSGRTPSQPFPAVRGQPTKRYSGRSTRVKPGPPGFPLGRRSPGRVLVLGGASRLGDVRCGSLAGSALRTRRTLVSRIRRRQIPSADAQDAHVCWGRACRTALPQMS